MADAAAVDAGSTPASAPQPRFDPRRSHRSQFHARVRADALARQRAARGEGLEAARRSRMQQQEQQQEQEGGAGQADSDAAAAAAAAPSVEAASEGRGGTGAASSPSSSSPHAPPPPRPFWARQLTRHEWMVDVPEDLASNWLVMPRPEGVRCLLVSGRGRTVARGRNGAVLHEFSSLLPGGGGGSRGGGGSGSGGGSGAERAAGGSEGSCVLDAIFQPDPPSSPGQETARLLPGTFFAIDVLQWGGRDLCGCDAAFRLRFWLPAKLAEAGCGLDPSPAGGAVARVVPLAALEASPEGILAAVSAGGDGGEAGGSPARPSSFTRDGVLFVHKESAYCCDEASPLSLVWKDRGCSRYVVETDASGRALERQGALLRVVEVGAGGVGAPRALAAATGDDPPVPLAPVPSPFSSSSSSSPEQQQQQQNQEQLPFKPGRLLRFAVGPGGFSFGGGNGAADDDASSVVSADLEFVAALPASSSRLRGAGGGADTLSKLLFQHAARHGALPTLQGLLEAARQSRGVDGVGGGGGGGGEEAMNLG